MHIHTCNVHTSSCICVCGCSCASVHLSIYDGPLILIIIHIWVFDLLLGSFSGTRLLYLHKKWPQSKRLSWKVQGWLFKFENLFKMRRFRTWYIFMLEWLFTWWSQGFFPLPFFHTQRKKNQSFCHFFLAFGEEWKTKTSHVEEDRETSQAITTNKLTFESNFPPSV